MNQAKLVLVEWDERDRCEKLQDTWDRVALWLCIIRYGYPLIFALSHKMKYFVPIALLSLLMSCFEQGDCSDVSANVMQLNFYSNADKKSKTILIDSIEMVGWDTVMYVNKSLSNITLPLDPATDTVTYIFYHETKRDLLGVSYQFKTFALAPDCNAIDLITLVDANPTGIQESKIIQPKLINRVAENIKLYF